MLIAQVPQTAPLNPEFVKLHPAGLKAAEIGFGLIPAPVDLSYLAGWRGPVDESEDPYPNPNNSPSGLTVRKHAQQIRIIPGKSSPTGNDVIKQAVMDNGALYAGYYHNDCYWNPVHNTYNFTSSAWGNHADTPDNYAAVYSHDPLG